MARDFHYLWFEGSYVSVNKMLPNYALLTDILLFCSFDTL